MASTAFDLAALTLSNPVAGAKGAKTATLSYQNKPIIWQPDAQTVAFEPTAYQNEVNATRVNLVMRASLQTVETLTELDEHMINIWESFLSECSPRLMDCPPKPQKCVRIH